ncbi:UNVERIFIED_CONTAM: tmk [Trichonephila clavipes]
MPKSPNTSKSKKKPKAKPKSTFKAFWIAIFLLALVIFGILWANLFKNYPVDGKKQLLVISSGDTYSRFIDRLTKEGKVSLPIVLKLYQKFLIHDTMKAGVYEVTQGMSIRQVLSMLSDAENAQMNRILVIEGTTFKQLVQNLKKDSNVTKTILDLPQDQLLKALDIPYSHPEGLFAPDTYFFAKGETDKKILTDLYHRQMKSLDEAWTNKASNLPYKDKYEALIMASIIEKETSLDSELQQVSGVFVRRLKIGMRLQTDPTVIYGMGENYKGNITRNDLRTPTSYNTYTINGLPPTPIALPSKKAIEAAMHPDDAKNIYFVATGNGGHKFTASLEDHNRAVQEYLTVLRSKKKQGTEGVGKTTLIRKIHQYFEQQGKEVVLTREPGGTPLAEQIRSLLLAVNHEEQMSHDTELLLIYAARAQHLEQVILPALEAGKIVLSDRFTDASFAYQCSGRGLSQEKLQLLNQTFVAKMPNITFWLDAPIELGMTRARERGALDRFEQEKLSFFTKVRAGYETFWQAEPERIKRLDATQNADVVFEEALQYLK